MTGTIEKTVSMLKDLNESDAYRVYVFTLDLYKNKSLNIDDGEDNVRKKLNDISKLGDNWNGYGAAPISQEVVEKVSELLDSLIREPEVFPTADDTIQLQYDGKNDSYLEFNVGKSEDVSVLLIDKLGKEKSFTVKYDKDGINKIVGEISSFE